MFECYRGGRKVSEFTNGQIGEKSIELWNNHFSKSSAELEVEAHFNYEVTSGQTAKPVFMSLDLETPLGFATFMANASNQRKVFIPSTFNMSTILRSVSA